jgi:hypothetical protein
VKWLLVVGALGLVACNPARALIASPSDYAAYRRVRTAETADARVAAAWEYLKSYPEGRYAERLRSYLARVEPVYYKIRRRNVAGLEAYLRALPDGPHAADALGRLMLLTDRERREPAELRGFAAAQTRLDARLRERERAAELLGDWLVQLLDPKLWQVPLARGPGPFVVRFELGLPQPLCEATAGGRHCVKAVEQPYALPISDHSHERAVAFEIDLRLDARGTPTSAGLRGPALFVRSEEARRGKPIDELDLRAVREAQRAYLARLTSELVAADVLCEGTTESDGTAVLNCEGVRLTLEPGAAEDRLTVAPIDPANE